jgi:DNA ligase (NAD+)
MFIYNTLSTVMGKNTKNTKNTKSISSSEIKKISKDPVRYAHNTDIEDIVTFLKYCASQYYDPGHELVISDGHYDIINEILEERDPSNIFLKEIGTTDGKNKVKLPYPMASLDKVKPYDTKLNKWIKKYKGPYVVSDKLDGISAQLIKHNNGIIKMYTRGDAVKGRDITHLVKHIVNKSAVKNLPKGCSVRGEIVIPKKDFVKIKKKYPDKYANGRAAASGLSGATENDYNKDLAKYARLVVYSMIYPDDDDHYERMKTVKEYGFDVVWYKVFEFKKSLIKDDNFDKKLQKISFKRREESKYDIDGIVCVDSSQVWKITDKNPKHAFAFKVRFDDQTEKTTVIDIEWTPTMYSYIKPVAIFEEVIIGGAKITRATCHNAKYIKEQKIGKGSIILLTKSGDVIPYISKVVKHSKKPLMPKIDYKWNETKIDIIAQDLSGSIGEGIDVKRIQHFFKTLEVKYISEGIINKLYDAGYVDIFQILKSDHEDLKEISGIGTLLVDKIFKEINKKLKTCKLHILMASSLIFGRTLGRRKIKWVIDEYPNILIDSTSKKDLYDNILNIKGYSDKTTKQFTDNLDEFKKFYKKLKKYIDISHLDKKIKKVKKSKSSKSTTKAKFNEEKVVFTGFRDKELEDFIQDNGGNVTSSVSKNTTMLVYVHDTSKSKPSKLIKAEELYEDTGKPIVMTKEHFKKKYIK